MVRIRGYGTVSEAGELEGETSRSAIRIQGSVQVPHRSVAQYGLRM
jgi:hypothetical protein